MRFFTLLLTMIVAVGCKRGNDDVVPPPVDDDKPIYGFVFIHTPDVECDWLRDTVDIRFWSNEEWHFDIDSTDMEWLTLSQTSGIADSCDITLQLVIAENPLFERRTSVLNINDIPSITVTQSKSRRQLDDLNREEL